MTDEALMDRLAGRLTPVRPRRVRNEITLLGFLALVEGALLFALGMMRGELAQGMNMPAIELWKIGAPAILAVVATLLALRGGDPARARVGLGAIALLGVAVLAAGIGVGASTSETLSLRTDGATTRGLACVLAATLFACPPALALGIILRRAAPARPRPTALAAGVAAGAFGATLLGLHCPDDGVVHSVLWHLLAVFIPALAAMLPIARAARW